MWLSSLLDTSSIAQFAFASAFFVGLTFIGLAIGALLERRPNARRIWSVPFDSVQSKLEVRGNIQFVVVQIAALSIAFNLDLVRTGDGVLRGVLTFLALLVGFQAYYYALHRAMHTRHLVRFHRHHHQSHVTRALSGQSMSIVEAIGWAIGYVGMPALFSLVAPLSLYGWLAYLAFNVVGNIVGHASVEIIKSTPSSFARAPSAPPFTYHALHHARWTGHYGFAAAWADRVLSTEWKDWPALHAKVWSGTPMASLKERG